MGAGAVGGGTRRSRTPDRVKRTLRHTEELKQSPSEWMPWNYRETVERLATQVAA
jgi:hypothetical protein